jgi:hypothetical protein
MIEERHLAGSNEPWQKALENSLVRLIELKASHCETAQLQYKGTPFFRKARWMPDKESQNS